MNALVRTPAEVTELVVGLAGDLAAGSVRYAEVTVTPVSHLSVGIGAGALAEALVEGRERARAEHGVELGPARSDGEQADNGSGGDDERDDD